MVAAELDLQIAPTFVTVTVYWMGWMKQLPSTKCQVASLVFEMGRPEKKKKARGARSNRRGWLACVSAGQRPIDLLLTMAGYYNTLSKFK